MLYDSAVEVAKEYMGPSAKDFIDRQLSNHLKIKPEELDVINIKDLAKWCFYSGKLYLRDDAKAHEFEAEVANLRPGL
jgi:hypothetical protein